MLILFDQPSANANAIANGSEFDWATRFKTIYKYGQEGPDVSLGGKKVDVASSENAINVYNNQNRLL